MYSTITKNYQQLKLKIENLPYLELIDYKKRILQYKVYQLNFPIDCTKEIIEYLWLLIQDQRNQLTWEQICYDNDMIWLHQKIEDYERHFILWKYKKILEELKEYGIELE